jgi:dGTPase
MNKKSRPPKLLSPSFMSSLRLWPDKAISNHSPFALDLDRIMHSSYFRRLQGKTQVWGVQESDFFRTRLTHSLETGYIGRSIAIHMELDQDLVFALCLAHDLGHPPFAHEGARLLDHFALAQSQGRVRFDDNAQNLRIITRLAGSYKDTADGLNPSASMIDGLIKYKRTCSGSCGWYPEEDEIVSWAAHVCGTGERRNPLASIVEISDDLAYASHDLEDAIRAEMIRLESLELALERMESERARNLLQGILQPVMDESARSRQPDTLRQNCTKIRKAILEMLLTDILEISQDRSFKERFFDPASHESMNPFLIELPHLAEILSILKEIVLERVIHAPNVQTLRFASLSLLESYLERFWPLLNEPQNPMYRHALLSLPKEWQVRLSQSSDQDDKLRLLLDYIAGMSDQYLMNQAHMFYNPLAYRAFGNRK